MGVFKPPPHKREKRKRKEGSNWGKVEGVTLKPTVFVFLIF
jgi:hypothetical protein